MTIFQIFTQNHYCQLDGGAGGKVKVIRIHRLGPMNILTKLMALYSIVVEIFASKEMEHRKLKQQREDWQIYIIILMNE